MDWNEEFALAMASFGNTVPEPLEYRVHYNTAGDITMCTAQQHPKNTQYLVVDCDAYENYFRYRVNVSRKRLEKIDINLGISVQLKKSDKGYAVVKNHAGLLLEDFETHPDIEYYDTTN